MCKVQVRPITVPAGSPAEGASYISAQAYALISQPTEISRILGVFHFRMGDHLRYWLERRRLTAHENNLTARSGSFKKWIHSILACSDPWKWCGTCTKCINLSRVATNSAYL